MGPMPHPVCATPPALRRAAVAVVVAGMAGLAGLFGLAAATVLSTRSRRYDAASVPATEVGAVLGAEVYPDGTPSDSLRGRLDLAARLYHAGKVRRLIASGDEAANSQVSAMARYLVEQGVAEDDVILDPLGVDTYATCSRAQAVYGLAQVTMISQDYHLPRALVICRLIGLDAYGVGDWSVRRGAPAVWRRSVRREIGANLKMLADLARHPLRKEAGPHPTMSGDLPHCYAAAGKSAECSADKPKRDQEN